MENALVLVLAIAVVGLVVTGIGLAFIVIPIRRFRRARRQRSWPSVTGRVMEAGLRQATVRRRGGFSAKRGSGSSWTGVRVGGSHGYVPQVAYQYEVGGESYGGSNLGLALPNDGYSRKRAERMLADYKPGAGVTVHYDPEDPSESVLKPGRGGFGWAVAVFIGLVWLGFGGAILYGAYAVATAG